MKLSYRWLGEMVDLAGTPPTDLRRLLTFHTAEVEGQEVVGGGLDDVVVARVLAVRPHPGADKLRLCTLDAGREPVEVVCGAPNVAEGQHVAYAPEGTTLPGGPDGEPFTLQAREIRGVLSRGMICSARELSLGEEHDGILVLPGDAPVGVALGNVLPLEDTVFDVDNVCVTHRPDLWGHVGWAREVGAVLGRPLQPPEGADPGALPTRGEPFPVRIEDPQGCRRYVGIVIENLVNGPSPLALRRRLESLGVRSIDLLVDLTNLVLLEQGQPLHAFDLRDVRGGVIRVRAADPGETIVTLDGQTRGLGPEDLVIADGEGAVAVAGVMGGAHSEVRADTTAILLESATFDPVRIRRTAARLGLRTEASTRFEKGLDPELALQAALRFTRLVLEHVPGARVARPVADLYPRPYPPVSIDLPYGLVRRRLGLHVGDFQIRRVLASLGFDAVERGEHIHVVVPSWRATRDVGCPEDLVEEVGRIEGYDRLPAVAPIAPMAPQRPPPQRALERRAAEVLSLDLGYAEVKQRSFYGGRDAERLGLGDVAHLALRNPGSEEHDRMILTTAAGLLATAARNQLHEPRARLWTSGRLFLPRPVGGPEGLPVEVPVFGLVGWDRADEDAEPGAVFLGLVDDLRRLLERLGAAAPSVRDGAAPLRADLPEPAWLHPGRRAVLRRGDEVLAVAGELLPSVVRAFDLRGRVALAEVDAGTLLAATCAQASSYEPVLRYPVVPFDVAVVVPRRTPAADVMHVVETAVGGSLRGLHVFDVYEGAGIPDGHRSIALRCELFDRDRTLTSKAADALRTRIVEAIGAHDWRVRAG
jgi:phenylalanyl-tRNA synthetase beta chain